MNKMKEENERTGMKELNEVAELLKLTKGMNACMYACK